LRISSFIFVSFLFVDVTVFSQHKITIEATLIPTEKSLEILQVTEFVNNSEKTLDSIYFNDWANSFSSKTTPLAKRFAENYESNFHFERDEDRGRTDIHEVKGRSEHSLSYRRGDEVDILIVDLDQPLKPGDTAHIRTRYTVRLPDDKFTRFGVRKDGSFQFKYWYLSPAVYDNGWKAYSNKNTEDLYRSPSEFDIKFHIPTSYLLISDLDVISETSLSGFSTYLLHGEQRNQVDFYLIRIDPSQAKEEFETILTDKLEVITNIEAKNVNPAIRAIMVDRVVHFLDEQLGDYPFKKMVVSNADYKNSPVYGLNQLPSWISPFPDGFEFEMEQLKTITANYLERTLSLHPRNEYWL
jgi:hypothetical protein